MTNASETVIRNEGELRAGAWKAQDKEFIGEDAAPWSDNCLNTKPTIVLRPLVQRQRP